MAFHCKCTVVPIKVGVKNEDAYVIHPCPVHEAAPDMLAALKEIEIIARKALAQGRMNNEHI